MTPLPIDPLLPTIRAALRDSMAAVLAAPPGAGKTTRIAPTLLGEPWCTGELWLLSPRRVAARAAAERMATEMGEPVGQTIGYATRLDTRRSARTRVTVATPGVFLRRIQADPELAGLSGLLFDEVHERSLASDFALALALDAQVLRPELRVLAMSATLEVARLAALLGDAPVIESAGRSFPVELRHLGRRREARIEAEVAAAVRLALADGEGGVLAFLPGVAEIERTAEQLAGLPPGVEIHRLHGTLDPAAQRRAIAAPPHGIRKVVLATAIAETSLTLDGVRAVVDSGLARRPRYDRGAGLTRLVTERVSQAAAIQRAGRAGRQAPGTAYRLWEAPATAGLSPYDPPEILEADLSALVLDCALWGVADARTLRWLDPPPEAALAEAHARLLRLGAIDADGRPTLHGRALAGLPLPPRLGHMLVRASGLGCGRVAAEVAVLLSERGIGGDMADLHERRERWRQERGSRAEAARRLAARWMEAAGPDRATDEPADATGLCVALAFPERVARQREPGGERWASVGGRGFVLDPASPLARGEWLAVAETSGAAAGARILSAAPILPATLERLFAGEIVSRREVRFDPASRGIVATRERRLGAIRLGGGPDEAPDTAAITAALVEGVRRHGLGLLPWPEAARMLQARAHFAGIDPAHAIDDGTLLDQLDDWLPDLLAGARRLDRIPADALLGALQARLGWENVRRLDRLAPTHLETPAGSRHPIDYAAEGGPVVELRPQALFGLRSHPLLGEPPVPLVLRLVSPAGRPIQVTQDLPGFWAGSWAAVAREMRGRYPRHPWPDDPGAAAPTLRTKRAAQP